MNTEKELDEDINVRLMIEMDRYYKLNCAAPKYLCVGKKQLGQLSDLKIPPCLKDTNLMVLINPDHMSFSSQ